MLSVKAKIRALTHKTSQQDLEYVLTSLNMVMHGWANYFRHAVAKKHVGQLHLVETDPHAARKASLDVVGRPPPIRHRLRAVAADRGGRDVPRKIAAIPVTRYRYRSTAIPSPWPV